jgi:hypothetical protein
MIIAEKLLACAAWQYFCALNGINGLKPDDANPLRGRRRSIAAWAWWRPTSYRR